jgi:hypothetical protein
MFNTDSLIEAVKDLEVAVDDYTFGVYVNVTNPDPEDVPVSKLSQAIVDASLVVVAAMTDGDISLVTNAAAVNVIPMEIRERAADAEMGSLRALRAARAARNADEPTPSWA